MLGDSSMIPVPGAKGALKPQGTINSMKQLRIDHKKWVSKYKLLIPVAILFRNTKLLNKFCDLTYSPLHFFENALTAEEVAVHSISVPKLFILPNKLPKISTEYFTVA